MAESRKETAVFFRINYMKGLEIHCLLATYVRHGRVLITHPETDKPSETGVSKGLCGAATRSRTRDLMITNQLLYQLSYSGVVGAQNNQLV